MINLYRGGAAAAHHDDHGDHHEHHEEIVLNQKELVGNKDIIKDMVSLHGFKDINDENFHEFSDDPYAHLRGYPILSFRRIFFHDPFYVPDEDEPLMNEPHGYLTSDDPLDVRNNSENALLEYAFYFLIAVMGGVFLGYQGLKYKGHAVDVWELNYTAEQIDNEIRKIRIDNSNLEKRKQELLEQLNQ